MAGYAWIYNVPTEKLTELWGSIPDTEIKSYSDSTPINPIISSNNPIFSINKNSTLFLI